MVTNDNKWLQCVKKYLTISSLTEINDIYIYMFTENLHVIFRCHVAWLLLKPNSVTNLFSLNPKILANITYWVFFGNFGTQTFFFNMLENKMIIMVAMVTNIHTINLEILSEKHIPSFN